MSLLAGSTIAKDRLFQRNRPKAAVTGVSALEALLGAKRNPPNTQLKRVLCLRNNPTRPPMDLPMEGSVEFEQECERVHRELAAKFAWTVQHQGMIVPHAQGRKEALLPDYAGHHCPLGRSCHRHRRAACGVHAVSGLAYPIKRERAEPKLLAHVLFACTCHSIVRTTSTRVKASISPYRRSRTGEVPPRQSALIRFKIAECPQGRVPK